MIERIPVVDKIKDFVVRVRYGAEKDPLFGALGPFLGVKYSVYNVSEPEEKIAPEPVVEDNIQTET